MERLKTNTGRSDVIEFYKGKTIFITGGAGFIGKLIIEKLLYTCDITKIYVLIRKKKNMSPETRMHKLLNHVVFKRVRDEKPRELDKVVPLVGDILEPNLGFSSEDWKLLTDTVTVVFHGAAILKFNEELQTAVLVNVEGTRTIMKFCHSLKRLDALVHLSTAYSNTDKKVIAEKVYPAPATLNEVNNFVKTYGNDEDKLMKFLNGRPNTYTYTKALTEDLIAKTRGNLPVAIVRPSIVTSVMKEPLPGWLENWNGATCVSYFIGRGLSRFPVMRKNCVADVIPVDVVSNMIIVAAVMCQRTTDLKVYNCCSGPSNPITHYQFLSQFAISSNKFKKFNDVPYAGFIPVPSLLVSMILTFLSLTVPAYIADFYLRLVGKQPRFAKSVSLLIKAEQVLAFFKLREWEFEDGNVRWLINCMSDVDAKIFYCDPAEVKWAEYMDDYYLGIYNYLHLPMVQITRKNSVM